MHIDIWNDKIILRTNDPLPDSLVAYGKYNEKFRGYLFWLGAQNLRRIYRAFNNVEIRNGKHRVDELKIKFSETKSIISSVDEIKKSTALPELDFKMRPLGDYQHRGTCFLLSNPMAPLFASPGMGKTYMVLMATSQLIKEGKLERGKTLICGKLATLETGWLEDTEKFTDLKAVMLWLPASSKRKEKLLKLLDEPADIYVINHDGVLILEGELAAKNFDQVVVDESTILKSYHGDFAQKGGKFGKALMNVSKNASRRVIMSGTPAPNGAFDLWGQFKFLDPEGFFLEPCFKDFKTTYMQELFFGKGEKAFSKWVMAPGAVEEIQKLTEPLSYQVKIRDHLHDLPPKTVIKHKIPMSKDQHDYYLEMLENLSTIINDEFVAVDVKLAQLSKLRQITGGFLIDQEEKPHEIKGATKLQALDDLLEDIGDEKVVIYAQFRWEIKTIEERYKDKGIVTVYGGNKSEDNLKNIKDFIHNPDVKIILLHPKSAAHGITLTVAHYMIFYSISYSAEDDYQCVARIERAGQKHPVFIHYLLSKFHSQTKTEDTIDEIIYRVLQSKIKAQSELIDQETVNNGIIASFRKN